MTATRVLVPVSESVTLRNTVAHVVREVRDAAESGAEPTVHFVYPLTERDGTDTEERDEADELLDRVTVWAKEDLGEDAEAVTVETAVVAQRTYLFSPSDYAAVLARYARENDIEAAVFDPEYHPVGTTPLLPPLEAELERAGLTVTTAPVERERRGSPLVRRGSVEQFLALFGLGAAFYLVLAWSLAPFELVTGAISAAVVAVALRRVSLTGPLDPLRTVAQLGRLSLYTPYLLWEIAKSNLEIAYIVLHPDLPIDPQMVAFDAAVWTPLSVTTLANSITLTPGTLTVDVTRREFAVHALTSRSADSLLEGGLERAVRFVFYGRSAARIASPRERGARTRDERQAEAAEAASADGDDGATTEGEP